MNCNILSALYPHGCQAMPANGRRQTELLCLVVKLSNYLEPNCRQCRQCRRPNLKPKLVSGTCRGQRGRLRMYTAGILMAHIHLELKSFAGAALQRTSGVFARAASTRSGPIQLSLSRLTSGSRQQGSFLGPRANDCMAGKRMMSSGGGCAAHTKLFGTRTGGRKEKGP